MPSFRYQYGDRPLDGFTIQHGLGRGGFGEVYYAISDSGREVALKAVQQYEEIELRGIGHCMNLKSHHLISIFDVKHTARGEPFVIMEYVNGPSLRDILDESPHGLGPTKSAYLLREIAKGMAYLHQNGIVHRDLKPHNIFVEQGVVKIGDYSLSKMMTASHRSGHTVTVGTVHYMAPEIGLGRYDHTVDIYALGVIFYEMLTGVPPFRGDSVGEVLMKHVSGEPELSHLAEPYARVIRKAMSKDPRLRYQNVDEMVVDVLGSPSVQDSLAGMSIDDLSMVAHRAIQRDAFSPLYVAPDNVQTPASSPRPVSYDPGVVANQNMPSLPAQGFVGHLLASFLDLAQSIGLRRGNWPDYWGPVSDPVGRFRRLFLAFCAVAFFVFIPSAFAGFEEEMVAPLIIWIGGGTLITLAFKTILLPVIENRAGIVYRFLFGIVASGFFAISSVFLCSEIVRGPERELVGIVGFACCIPMWLLDWRVMSSPIRPFRFAFTPMLGTALLTIFPPAMWVVAGIATAVQLASKYDPVLSQRFGLNFPWIQHLRNAFLSLLTVQPRRHVQTTGVKQRAPIEHVLEANQSAAAKFHWISKNMVKPLVQPWIYPNGVARASSQVNQAMETYPLSHPPRVEPKVSREVPVNEYSAVLVDSLVAFGGSVKRFTMNIVALVMVSLAWLVGMGIVTGIPQAVATIAPQNEVSNIEGFFGNREWPQLANKVMLLVAMLVAVPGIGFLLYIRKQKNQEHMQRALIAVGILSLGLICFGKGFRFGEVWEAYGNYFRGGEPGFGITKVLNEAFFPFAVGLTATLTGIVMLLWPASKTKEALSTGESAASTSLSVKPSVDEKDQVVAGDVK